MARRADARRSREDTINTLVEAKAKMVDKREPLSHALGPLFGHTDAAPVVADRGKPFAVVPYRRLMHQNVDARTRIEKYAVPTGCVDETTPVEEAARKLAANNVDYFPVMRTDEGSLAGVVKAPDLLPHLEGLEGPAEEYALEVPWLTPETRLGEAVHLFSDVGVPALPVVGETGRTEGILWAREMLNVCVSDPERKPPGHFDFSMGEYTHHFEMPVKGFMSAKVHEVPPSMDVLEAAGDLKKNVEAVVVARDTDIRGILTGVGITRRYFEEQKSLAKEDERASFVPPSGYMPRY